MTPDQHAAMAEDLLAEAGRPDMSDASSLALAQMATAHALLVPVARARQAHQDELESLRETVAVLSDPETMTALAEAGAEGLIEDVEACGRGCDDESVAHGCPVHDTADERLALCQGTIATLNAERETLTGALMQVLGLVASEMDPDPSDDWAEYVTDPEVQAVVRAHHSAAEDTSGEATDGD